MFTVLTRPCCNAIPPPPFLCPDLAMVGWVKIYGGPLLGFMDPVIIINNNKIYFWELTDKGTLVEGEMSWGDPQFLIIHQTQYTELL